MNQSIGAPNIGPGHPGIRGIPPINIKDESVRFQVELEFVQCLANPNYLNFLAQRDYFKVCT